MIVMIMMAVMTAVMMAVMMAKKERSLKSWVKL